MRLPRMAVGIVAVTTGLSFGAFADHVIAAEDDLDRVAAQWILEQSGSVRCLVDGKLGPKLTDPENLPTTSFRLQEIELADVRIGPDDLKRLEGLAALERLLLTDVNVTDGDVARFASLPKLNFLVLRGAPISGEGLRHLAGLKNLKTLSLIGSTIADDGLAHLGGLQSLGMLNLEATDVTDDGMVHLQALKQLSYLILNNVNVGDRGAEALAQIPSLRTLLLSNTLITDAGAAKLQTLTELKALNLVQLKISPEAQKELQTVLPNCKVSVGVPGKTNPPTPASPPLPAAAAAPASVRVVALRGLRPVAVQDFCPQVPAFLQGSVVYGYRPKRRELNAAFGAVEVIVEQDTALFTAVSRNTDPSEAGPWRREVLSNIDLWKDGWVAVGKIPFRDPNLPAAYLYWRVCKAGERMTLRTDRFVAPLVFVPPRPDVDPLDQIPTPDTTPDIAAYVLRAKTHYLLAKGRYDELEAYVARLRRERPRFPSGLPYLSQFYDGLKTVASTENDWNDQLKDYEAWLAARPKSLAAHLALASYWENYAWKARGGGYANTVTPEGWALFRERIAKVRDILNAAEALEERDPYLCRRQIHLAVDMGGSKQEVERIVGRSLEIDPDYFATPVEAVRYFLPRWHGDRGDLEAFAKHVAELTKQRHGDGLYAAMVAEATNYHGSRVFNDFQFNWNRVKTGIADLKREFPEAVHFDEWLAELACYQRDREAARAGFLAARHAGVWMQDTRREQWRIWAQDDYLSGDQKAAYDRLSSSVCYVGWTIDGKYLTTFDAQDDLTLWDAETGDVLTRRNTNSGLVRFAALLPSTNQVAAVGYDGHVLAAEVDSGQSRTLGVHADLQDAALSPDGHELVTSGADKHLKFWNLVSGRLRNDWNVTPEVMSAIAYLPDGLTLVTGGRNRRVMFWSRETEKPTGELPPFKAGVRFLRVSTDGKLLAVVAGNELSVWRLPEREQIHTLQLPQKAVNTVAMSSDGRRFAAATYDRNAMTPADIVLWDLEQGKLLRTLQGHKAIVRSLGFSPDGESLVSGGDDMSVRIWSTK